MQKLTSEIIERQVDEICENKPTSHQLAISRYIRNLEGKSIDELESLIDELNEEQGAFFQTQAISNLIKKIKGEK